MQSIGVKFSCLCNCLNTEVDVVFLLHRYEEQNVTRLGSIRKYNADVSLFLHNHPRYFVAHGMKCMSPSCPPIPPELIADYTDGVYTVSSSDMEATVYAICCVTSLLQTIYGSYVYRGKNKQW